MGVHRTFYGGLAGVSTHPQQKLCVCVEVLHPADTYVSRVYSRVYIGLPLCTYIIQPHYILRFMPP